MNTRYDYICDSWQGLLQQLVYLIGNGGYYHYHIQEFPEAKRHNWETIDNKIIERYGTKISKWDRSRQKKKGYITFYYLGGIWRLFFIPISGEIRKYMNSHLALLLKIRWLM